MFVESMIDFIESGVADGSRKTLHPGKVRHDLHHRLVAAFVERHDHPADRQVVARLAGVVTEPPPSPRVRPLNKWRYDVRKYHD